jgi:hypothetical protein
VESLILKKFKIENKMIKADEKCMHVIILHYISLRKALVAGDGTA